MKIPHLSLLTLLLLAAPAFSQTATATLYTEAQRAYMGGDVATAKEKFLAVLSADPNHEGAKNYLKTIAVSEKTRKKSTLSTQLAGLVVPKLSFKEATFDSVLEFLKAKASELSGNKIATSFVQQLPPDFAKQTPITLELSNVPFTEVLRYLGEMTSTKFEIQEYAIVVKPKA